ncbi:UDP-glucuronate:xylan alpha-glucuronosyltransferase 1-like [Ananas comosus]|uniref:Hexosyltransferase n=1 Tax=Ananas comosus TaxID=4615 RepID=A0A6P5EG00_ANACO|nr:UDP-glucuronate:xylan alpha-glucuronosyltransferase 1-like [Ananas comosus]
MRGLAGIASVHAETRHRLAPTNSSKRRFQRSSYLKDGSKPFIKLLLESSGCKVRFLRFVLVVLTCGFFLMLMHSPTVHYKEHFMYTSSRFVTVGWMWNPEKPDTGYKSNLIIDWSQISKAIGKLNSQKVDLKTGLLNFNKEEINTWQSILPHTDVSVVHLDHVQKNVTWEDLYPEWIDEEEESEVPSCPNFPNPKLSKKAHFDIVAVKLPCRSSKGWSRDVAQLHLQLAAARIAVESTNFQKPVFVLVVSRCLPIPNLFKCKYLAFREGDVWVYKPELRELREKLQLPVGSCKLALPFKAKEHPYLPSSHRVAYATILHSESVYVCGAITVAQSIRQAGSTIDLIILVDENINNHHRSGLKAAGWKIRTIKRIRNPKAEPESYNEWNYSKFWLWRLTDYDKIIFIDADLLILRNIDVLFSMPEISAIGNNGTLFNSGVMVIEPSNCTFQLLMDHIGDIESYNGGDQGYLNEIFTWWHRIPSHMNFLKHFWEGDVEETKALKTYLFGADPPTLHVLHYLGLKPWLCFRDYDCNWNVDNLQEFASDVAHARWWKVHDRMTTYLQSFCLLSEKQKGQLEWDRIQARKANYSDGHWKRTITDPRRNICNEEICNGKKKEKLSDDRNRLDHGFNASSSTKIISKL